jgi:hypothetical protein
MTFDEWINELNAEAVRRGLSQKPYVSQASARVWQDAFDAGETPADALSTDIANSTVFDPEIDRPDWFQDISAHPPGKGVDDVIHGEDGWLFLARGNHFVLDYITGNMEVTEQSFKDFDDTISERSELCAAIGAPYKHLVLPDKHSIIPQYFPYKGIIRLFDPYEKKCLKALPHIVYPLDVLTSAAFPTVLRTDTHLNDFGFALASAATIASLTGGDQDEYYEGLAKSITKKRDIAGDLGFRFEPKIRAPEMCLEVDWDTELVGNEVVSGSNGVVDIWTTRNAKHDARLLMFGGSSGRAMARMFSKYFREVVFFRTAFLHKDIMDELRPDFVVTQTVERYLRRVQHDRRAPSFGEYGRLKRDGSPHTPPQKFLDTYAALTRGSISAE